MLLSVSCEEREGETRFKERRRHNEECLEECLEEEDVNKAAKQMKMNYLTGENERSKAPSRNRPRIPTSLSRYTAFQDNQDIGCERGTST